MEQTLRVGVITSTHGVRGEVKVFPTTDDAKRFKKLKHVMIDTGKELKPMEIEQVKFFKNMVIVKFKGFDNINDIEIYKNKDILITREDAVPLGPDENFIVDLIGLKVMTDEGEELGTLKDVLQTGANDVYVVEMTASPSHQAVYFECGFRTADHDSPCVRRADGFIGVRP